MRLLPVRHRVHAVRLSIVCAGRQRQLLVCLLGPLAEAHGDVGARREDGVANNQKNHRDGVKNVYDPLMLLRVALLAHGEINLTVDGPNNDHGAREVDGVQQRPPARLELALAALERHKLVARHGTEAALEVGSKPARGEVEAGGNNRKQAKGSNLRTDTCEGNVLAGVQLRGGVGSRQLRAGNDDGADKLEEESEDVKTDKDGGQPARGHPQKLHCAGFGWHDVENNAAEGDIDDTGHEHGCEDDETELDDVEVAICHVVGRGDAGTVANSFHWKEQTLVSIQNGKEASADMHIIFISPRGQGMGGGRSEE